MMLRSVHTVEKEKRGKVMEEINQNILTEKEFLEDIKNLSNLSKEEIIDRYKKFNERWKNEISTKELIKFKLQNLK